MILIQITYKEIIIRFLNLLNMNINNDMIKHIILELIYLKNINMIMKKKIFLLVKNMVL